jgi:endonuclease/exonuclease/phosphatase family metal-dependent hydrolase
MTMLTVLTYNLRHGGGDRLPAIAEVIAGQRPDVVAVQELGAPGLGTLRRLGAALGMRGYAGRGWPGLWGQPVGVLLRPDLRVLAAGRVPGAFHHGAVRVVIDTDRGALAVLSAHLCPYAGWGRLVEARRLARRFASPADPTQPALLLGDLNALDPWRDHAAAAAALPARYRARHLRADGSVDTRAVAALARAGFTDLFRAVGSGRADTVPTRYAGREFSAAGMRLDYALGTPPVARVARDCRVVDDPAAHTASDHYPVRVTVDLRARTQAR